MAITIIRSGLITGSAGRWTFQPDGPEAAALPVIVIAAANPLSDIERGDLVDAGAVVLSSSVLAYGLCVWPSLKLGFRVKRAIFSGGVDLAYPFFRQAGDRDVDRVPGCFDTGDW